MRITKKMARDYWNKNVRLISILLTIWFAASYGIVILLGDVLKDVPFFGSTLPFWFGQQGSILTFLGLLFYYAHKMDRLNHQLEQDAMKMAEIIVIEQEAA